ncbi:hypothetical protein PHLGIDRAFT_34685 [Phlebiopsis gigantea 11061_1 CR5-6]|uniref:Uncharacterized protein n=1 Tax=Phlebiopsis gigantea (strain 11061_1 CR5-6) TaxID=745531 RepID=A0A0C3NUN6_PHLG1|nr:hypothetical protein PHLGIDRAFT_34685 [Phlebiopsis gigantea 11061_1 CR5-6]
MSLAIAAYPTNPMQTFPPPLPATHTPLRVRCGVTMRLHLSTHGLGLAQSWPSPKGHVQPHRNNLPRRRNPRRIVFHDIDEDDAAPKAELEPDAVAVEAARAAVEEAKRDSYAPAPPVNDLCFQEFLPGLNISFIGADDAPERLPGQSTSTPYTHIISMHCGAGPPTERLHEGRCQRLRLALPARDAAEAQPHLDAEGMQRGVRVLIAAPHGRPTDAMAVLACYLAFVTGKQAAEVLLWIDQDEEFLGAWKGEVSEDEAERVETIARAWSWLSQIVRPGAAA